MARRCSLLAAAGPAAAWTGIALGWLANRGWFSPLRGAFSDLGAPGARLPWIFNLAMVAAGVLVAGFACFCGSAAPGRLGLVGRVLLVLGGASLALVGVFPEGSRLHAPAAAGFFAASSLGVALLGLSLRSPLGRLAAAAAATVWPVAISVELLWGWPSLALLEVVAGALVTASMLVLGIGLAGGGQA